jgi:deoxyribonuclease V
VAGADVSYELRGKWLYAAIVVLRVGTWEVIDRSGIIAEARFPYVPGLLSFREAPPVIEAFTKLTVRPDVLICDGQGIAHPRRLGLASHIGLWLGLPTIGCAKSWLCGEYEEPGPERGDWTPLTDAGETIGAVVRTRTRVKPLYVSPGHLCGLESAIGAVLAAATKFRQPATTRSAHQYVNDLRRQSTLTEGSSAASNDPVI